MAEFVTVATVDEIPAGESKMVTVKGRMVAIFHQGDEFYAIDDLCPHMGASLSAGYVEDDTVICPWHAWRFSICDGSWLDNPKLKVDSFETRVEGQNVQVAIPEKPSATEEATEENDELPDC